MICIISKKQETTFQLVIISSTQVIQTGVPQGFVLGTLLFLLHINDLNKPIKNSTAHHFADDTDILFSTESLKPLVKKMSQDCIVFNAMVKS